MTTNKTTTTAPERVVLSPGEVAERFAVNPKTVSRWATAGRLPSFRTLGGHRRFYEDEVEAAMAAAMTEGR